MQINMVLSDQSTLSLVDLMSELAKQGNAEAEALINKMYVEVKTTVNVLSHSFDIDFDIDMTEFIDEREDGNLEYFIEQRAREVVYDDCTVDDDETSFGVEQTWE